MTTQQEQAVEDFLGEEVAAPEGEFPTRPGQELASSIGGQPIGAKVTEVDRGRWIKVYNTRTGDSSIMNIVHRPFLNPDNPRAWKWGDGTMMLSTTFPAGVTLVRGEFICRLHPNHEKRAYYDEIGLRGKTCFEAGGGKEGIPSEFDVQLHMEKRHRREWALIKEDEVRRERVDEREWQRTVLLMARGEVPSKPNTALEIPRNASREEGEAIYEKWLVENDYNSPPDRTPQEQAVSEFLEETTEASETPVAIAEPPKARRPMTILTCTECKSRFRAAIKVRAENKMKKHIREEHPG